MSSLSFNNFIPSKITPNYPIPAPKQPQITEKTLPLPAAIPSESKIDLKNKISLPENSKVAEAAAPILTKHSTLLGVLKATLLFTLAAGTIFALSYFIVPLALPVAIILGILFSLSSCFFLVWGMIELGRPAYLNQLQEQAQPSQNAEIRTLS